MIVNIKDSLRYHHYFIHTQCNVTPDDGVICLYIKIVIFVIEPLLNLTLCSFDQNQTYIFYMSVSSASFNDHY
jgi:hypothetical protein